MRSPIRRPDGIYDVNMTPLIDVSLVLVVILLVATPLALQSSIAVRNAAASGKTAQEVAPTDRIEVTVLSADSVRVNRRVLRRAAYGAALSPLLMRSGSRMVVVHCADTVPHGAMVSVLDETKQVGAAEIALVGR